MRTKPRGVWANFTTVCHVCGDEITVSNGRPDPHKCRIDLDRNSKPTPNAGLDLEQILTALERKTHG